MENTPVYSVIICNYNMEETLGQSIKSILSQVGPEWEIVVVDGGSSDQSVDIIEELQSNDDRIQLVALEPSSNRHLGRDRQIGVEKARGRYVIQHLDADDQIRPFLTEYVDIYQQIENQMDRSFALVGGGPLMATRDLLIEEPYRNLPAGEDKDLWRRLYDKDAIIWLDIPSLREPLNSAKSTKATLDRWHEIQIGDFQSGMSFVGYLQFLFQTWWESDYYKLKHTTSETIIKTLILPYSYIISKSLYEQYSIPDQYQKKGERHRVTIETQVGICDLDREYGVEIDMSDWDNDAKQFYCDSN